MATLHPASPRTDCVFFIYLFLLCTQHRHKRIMSFCQGEREREKFL
jgi:hypothetical protein